LSRSIAFTAETVSNTVPYPPLSAETEKPSPDRTVISVTGR